MVWRLPRILLHLVALAALGLLQGCMHGREAPPILPAMIVPESPVPDAWPLQPNAFTISSQYGSRDRVGGPNTKWHKGIDLSAPKGTPVYATAPGKVVFSGEQSGYGNIVILRHTEEYDTAYGHLHQRGVQAGKHVKRGALIGTVGQTGNATGPHLHYEVRRYGEAVNPAPYLPR
ncbi:MAG: M23 family metallopeptidase [Candidatus Hydrogenedentes bacterium]|nr:M23 family metallopeptidase [Candidatus Hydrogenedentota bacterium]